MIGPESPDALALIQTILERPDDDGPRMVFADWLTERGDPRGEFIAVQLQLARLDHDPYGCRDERCPICPDVLEQWDGLRAREIELQGPAIGHMQAPTGLAAVVDRVTSTFIPEWRPTAVPHGPWARAIQFTLRRGFVARISCRLLDWLGGSCPWCHGRGGVVRRGAVVRKCACCIDGRFPPHGPAIVRACPIERILICDYQPTGPIRHGASAGLYYWGTRTELPEPMWQRLQGHVESHEACLERLSALLLSWAKAPPVDS